MDLTPHQQRALATEHHVAVTANAGSGKTRVLVERYFRLVAGGAPPSEVLALTYTEKAAGELKRKFAERIRSALVAGDGDIPRLRLEEIRESFTTGFVGTIHAFCARLLREFPVEAGVDASFSVLEEIDSTVMIGEAVNETLAAIMSGEMEGLPRDELLRLVRDMGKARTRDSLQMLVRRRDLRARIDRKVYASGEDGVLALWKEELEGTLSRALSDAGFLADMETLIRGASGREHAGVEDTLGRLRGSTDPHVRASLLLQLLESVFTKEGSLRKSFFGKGGPEDDRVTRATDRILGLKPALLHIGTFVASGSPVREHQSLLRNGRTLMAIAAAATDRYRRRKDEEGRLDFEDLQLVTRDLLADENVRSQLARRFRYVMVDEFQDTNALQLDILLPLLDHLDGGNLFIVGDPKQSIYRFREADVRVFNTTTRDIAGRAGKRGDVRLGESFRPLRDIAAFVNLVFDPLLAEKEGARYDRLVVARANEAPGAVELLLADSGSAEGQSEAELVTRRLLALVREGFPVFDRMESARPIRFGDIAILLRSRNALPQFEEAFIRGGVPYAVSGGVGYFQTQDVYDTCNYLRFLIDAADEVALAGILRSPYFNVSDAELYVLSEGRRGKSLWKALGRAVRSGEGSPALGFAHRTLAEDRVAGVKLPVPELLIRIIERSPLPGALAGTPRGPQAMANLGKLISMARQFEGQGFNGLYDFVSRLRQLMEEEEREGQATVDSRADAVRVMTVHASKGLEFPVVCIPKLNASFGRDREPYIDEDLGLGFRSEEGDLPPIAWHMRNRERLRQSEEERRVFYVACTRARDMLILSSDAGGSPAGGESWFTWLCSALGEDPLAGKRILCAVETARYDPAGGAARTHLHELTIPIHRALPAGEPPLPAPPSTREGREIDLGRLESSPRGEIFSASKVRTYLECPSKYYYRYVLGYPLGTGPFAGGDEEETQDRDYPAELRGRIFHAVMERADLLRASGPSIDAAVTSIMALDLPTGSSAALSTDVAGLVRDVISSGAWGEIAMGTEVKTEYAISAGLGEDFITGTIDRLYRDRDGVWTILDYKTDAVSSAEAGGRASLYWAQLAFYAVMVRRLQETTTIRARIVFAAHPELPFVREFDTEALHAAEREISSVIGRIRAGDFTPGQQPCHGCPHGPKGCEHRRSILPASTPR
jgi:ATP-dependent helicase/nuclease subunit A